MNEKWPALIAECEKLSKATGVPMPVNIYLPPEGQPVGLEWADHRIRDARLLSYLAEFLRDVNAALVAQGNYQSRPSGRDKANPKSGQGDRES